jgi:hypothetical protein
LVYNGWVISPQMESSDYASYFDPRFVCGSLLLSHQRVIWLLSNQVRKVAALSCQIQLLVV